VAFSRFARSLRAADARVRSVRRERRATLRFAPNDPALSAPESALGTPPGTTVQWWVARQDLPAAWDVTRGEGALVGVIDTGVDAGHPELAGKIAGTGLFDRIPGDGPPTTDPVGHGTHVSSLACAATDNGVGLAGAGASCSLLIEKDDLSDSGVAQAIVDATDRHVDALNMSFGTDGSMPAAPAVVDAIAYAYAHNVVMAAAAADQPVSEQGDPANVLQPTGTGPTIDQGRGLTVTAATFNDQRASFAGLGSQISIAAYGAFANPGGVPTPQGPPGLFGAFPGNTTVIDTGSPGPPPQSPCVSCRTSFQGDSRYAYLQGTSMATPIVAAVGALVRHLNPDLSVAEILRIMKQTARRPSGAWTPDLGWGILDAGAAVAAARVVDHRPPTSHVLSLPAATRKRRIAVRWTDSDPAPPGLIPSGIDRFELWQSVNRRRFTRVAITSQTSRPVSLRPGSRYGFFTVAIDRAGNRQATPTAAQATVRVLRARRHRRRRRRR
jgi:subtilisin family serine protease